MRESIGGTWIMGIVIVFVVLFTSFLAYSISYTKAFNVKNEIINYIEHKEGFSRSKNTVDALSLENLRNEAVNPDEKQNNVEAKAYYLITQSGYNSQTASKVNCSAGDNPPGGEMMPGGYCLRKICPDGLNGGNVYYKVTTFIAIEIPVVSIVVNIPISGETRAIYKMPEDQLQCNN